MGCSFCSRIHDLTVLPWLARSLVPCVISFFSSSLIRFLKSNQKAIGHLYAMHTTTAPVGYCALLITVAHRHQPRQDCWWILPFRSLHGAFWSHEGQFSGRRFSGEIQVRVLWDLSLKYKMSSAEGIQLLSQSLFIYPKIPACGMLQSIVEMGFLTSLSLNCTISYRHGWRLFSKIILDSDTLTSNISHYILFLSCYSQGHSKQTNKQT